MHFYYCRICRSDRNLKYNIHQLLTIVKQAAVETQQNLLQDEQLLHSITSNTTLGNICHDCHEQLHNFHRLDDVGSGAGGVGGLGAENEDSDEMPIIVDDDEMLFNSFLQKMGNRKQNASQRPMAAAGGASVALAPRKCYNYDLTQHSLGSDGDTEVIEVLTSSRESTPAPTSCYTNRKEGGGGHHVVAIIDLDKECEKLPKAVSPALPLHSPPATSVVSSTEQSAKCSGSSSSTSSGGGGSARRKKNYSGRELRLIASLSLVSSDSECDEIIIHRPAGTITAPADANANATPSAVATTTAAAVRPSPGSDAVASTPPAVMTACPVCQQPFTATQSLINHLRCKHRSYDGYELSEQPRRAQDSAMTIRLRYLGRFTYYECQLCGRIDSCFKEHKQHIIDQHADESRSLNDPMMKTQRCPLCKEACGTQLLALCTHLLTAHADRERKGHMREVRSYSAFSCTISKQRQIHNTARVYQYCKQRKTYFFKCMVCPHVSAGYVNHMQHLTMHDGAVATPSPALPKVLHKRGRKVSPNTKGLPVVPPPPPPAPAPNCSPNRISLEQKQQQQRLLRTVNKFKINGTSIAKAGRAKERRRCDTRRRPIGLQKPKATATEPNCGAVSAATSPAYSTRITVKTKALLHKFPALSYKCAWCKDMFKGLYHLNMHHFKEHSYVDYYKLLPARRQRKYKPRSNADAASATDAVAVAQHSTNCNKLISINSDEEAPTPHQQQQLQQEQPHDNADEGTMPPVWLNELLQRNQSTNNKATTTTTIKTNNTATSTATNTLPHCKNALFMVASAHLCPYCTHLFTNKNELRDHEMLHLQQNHVPIVRYTAI